MLIFDTFPNHEQADAFAIHVRDTFGRATRVCASQEESDRHDPFPFLLQPPIVLVQRDESERGPQLESEIQRSVTQFHGKFAGT